MLRGRRYLANVMAGFYSKLHAHLWSLPALFFIGLFCYFPLARVISLGFGHRWLNLLCNKESLSISWFTIWQAALSTTIVLALAIPSAYVFYRVKFAGSRFLSAAITVPFVLPSIVVAIAIKTLWSNGGIFAVIMANVFMNYGFATRVIGVRWQATDSGVEEAAQLDGANGWQRYFWISARELAPAIKNSALLVFLYCTTNFGLMLVLGGGGLHSLETSIYSATSQILDLPRAAIYAFLQCLISLGVLMVLRSGFGQQFSFGYQRNRRALSLSDAPVTIFALLTSLLVVVLPIASLIRHSILAPAGWQLWRANSSLSFGLGHAAMNSTRNAGISLLIALVIGLYVVNSNNSLLLGLFRFPSGISNVAIGLGFLVTFSSGFFPLRSSWLVTPIAQSIVLIPLVIQIVAPAHNSLAHEYSDVAASDGLDGWNFWWWIKRPLLRQSLVTAIGYVVVVSVGEFSAANFLTYGDQATLPTALYQLLNKPGVINYQMALAASVLLIAFTATVMFLVEL